MSRSGYTDDSGNEWDLIKYRGQVASAIRGKRGQAFLRELIEALDALPEKRLTDGQLRDETGVCAIGAVVVKRGIPVETLAGNGNYRLADALGIAHQLVAEIEFENDEATFDVETPERRWQRMRYWAQRHLIEWEVSGG
jgi:hypothetical protein